MKLTIMRGLPASGKSTKAAELLKASGNAVRVNKDLLRTMLHCGKFSRRNEEITHQSALDLVMLLLKTTNVVVDDTNLNDRTLREWKDLGAAFATSVEIVDLTDVPVEECVTRDLGRTSDKRVGPDVIRNMALRAGLVRWEPQSVVLCDLDGTLCNIDHRLHHVKKTPKDWKAFFAEIPNDEINLSVLDRLKEHQRAGRTIVFVSARPDMHYQATTDWLCNQQVKHWVEYYTLIMRPGGDFRPDAVVKESMLRKHFPDLSVIHEVIDDRPAVVALWKSLGLNVVDVGAGVEF